MQITTIGLDLAKSVFQVHGINATGQVVVRKSLRRSQMLPFFTKLPPCLVGIEACSTSAPLGARAYQAVEPRVDLCRCEGSAVTPRWPPMVHQAGRLRRLACWRPLQCAH
jgi:hypothetical protein